MAGHNYNGRMSRGDRWGWASAAIVGLPIFAALLLVDALGDCAPDTTCRKGFLLMVLMPTVVIAGVVGRLARFIVTKFASKR